MKVKTIILLFLFPIFFACTASKKSQLREDKVMNKEELLYKVAIDDCAVILHSFQFKNHHNNYKAYKIFKNEEDFIYSYNEDSLNEKEIIAYLLKELPALAPQKVNEATFFNGPFIHLTLMTFNKKNRNEENLIEGISQEIFINPTNKQILLYIDDILYKSGILKTATYSLMNEIVSSLDLAEVIYQDNNYFITFIKDPISRYYHLILFSQNGSAYFLKEFHDAYKATTCKQVHLMNGKLHLEVIESAGVGSNVNSTWLHILAIDNQQKIATTVLEKNISGYTGPSSTDYWEKEVTYKDLDVDGILEIILSSKDSRNVFKYNALNIYEEKKK